VRIVRFTALDPDAAREHLATLVDLHARGLREPLPLATAPAAAYIERGEDAARREWDSRFNFDGEDERPEHRQAFGGVRSFDELLAERPRSGERWYPDEPTRFGQLARRLWSGVSSCEES
jgi:exodeoxyribonuclease V gamma subunit